ncbi:pentatricopeptide repeat-containing protein At3g60050-like [Apium graveolens]|uniref:pentatricopeptide repeat-containing protein At3g60050-like n=1 Tax=Apium graveolens TaxID=4045 RepID=UPI003D7910A8
MFTVALLGKRVVQSLYLFCGISRSLCGFSTNSDGMCDGFRRVEEHLNVGGKSWDFGLGLDEEPGFCSGRRVFEQARCDARRALEVLFRDGPMFDAKEGLDGMELRVSEVLVREVLFRILTDISDANKSRNARLGYLFFRWSSQQENYRHTVYAYHLMMRIFAESNELKAMWKLVDEMIERGCPTTARTFNIVICTSSRAGLARKAVERFIRSKNFYFRPFKHSFNAILCSLLTVNQYTLIEWVYQQMIVEGHCPDILTYNVLMSAKYRLGKFDDFHGLLEEMASNGLSPDFHTYNIILHVLGRSDKPEAAFNLLNHMKEVGIEPTVLHLTTLLDGLSRAGNLDACKYFFGEMKRYGCMPDVVCYTVMITGVIVAGDLALAEELYKEMINNGQVPNVYTYNAIIRGLCMARRFKDAFHILEEMEIRGCSPNFLVYNTLVRCLRNAGKLSEAHKVIRTMVEKGNYAHLISKLHRHRRR